MAKSPQMLRKDLANKTKSKESRQRKTTLSTAGIRKVEQIVNMMKPNELHPHHRHTTYLAMMQDLDVFTPYFANIVMVEKAFASYNIEYNKQSEKSKEASEFMHYCVKSTLKQSIRTFAGKAATFKRDKLALFEKGWVKGEGDYADFWCLNDLSYINPLTLSTCTPFTINQQGDKIAYARQTTDSFVNSQDVISQYKVTKKGYVEIPANKLAFVSDSGSDVQPFGISTFDAIYSEWRFKTLLKEVTLTGVTKDFSGTPVLTIPKWLQEEATSDPTGWQAQLLEDLQADMANMHAGDQCYISLPSDPHDGSTIKEFSVDFLGVNGGGKNFDTVALMEQSKKAIYNAFGAANLLAGDGTGGSYNQLEGQNSIHMHFVDRDVAIIEETLNRDIWKQTFRLNGFDLEWDEIPTFKAGAIEDLSLEELGKYIQRVGTSGYLPVVPEVINTILKAGKIPFEVPEDMPLEELREILSENTSAAGKGNGTSGTGTSQTNGDNNLENS